MVSDFRKFIYDDDCALRRHRHRCRGPGFQFNDDSIPRPAMPFRARLAPGGRIVMNVTVMHDIDPIRIESPQDCGDSLRIWIVDEQGILDRMRSSPARPKSSSTRAPVLNDS